MDYALKPQQYSDTIFSGQAGLSDLAPPRHTHFLLGVLVDNLPEGILHDKKSDERNCCGYDRSCDPSHAYPAQNFHIQVSAPPPGRALPQ